MLWAIICKDADRKRYLLIAAFSLFILGSNKPLASLIFSNWEYPAASVTELSKDFDIGIVLGGFSHNFSLKPNNDDLFYFDGLSANRLTQSIELYKRGHCQRLLISNGSVKPSLLTEADLIAAYLVDMGIPREDILVENKGINTYGNAIHTEALLDTISHTGNNLLLTSAFHMRRSKKCFDKTGLNATPFAVDYYGPLSTDRWTDFIYPDPEAFMLWEILIREWIGIVSYKVVGYL